MNNIIKSTEFDYETSKKYITRLCCEYDFLSASVIGRTGLGRAIFSLSVGNRKNSVLYSAGFNGSERLTSLVLLNYVEKLCHCIKNRELLCSVNISRAFSELGATFVPCVNPDGVEISVHGTKSAKTMSRFIENIHCDDYSEWNANSFGIDINRNFCAGKISVQSLEEVKPSPELYSGRIQESETETKALATLCRKRKFRQAIALLGKGEKLFWQGKEYTPAQSSIMAKILADSCNYSLIGNVADESQKGYRDWFIEEFQRPAFTMEVGKGENPLPVSEFDSICNRLEEALTIFALM